MRFLLVFVMWQEYSSIVVDSSVLNITVLKLFEIIQPHKHHNSYKSTLTVEVLINFGDFFFFNFFKIRIQFH